MRPIRNEMVMYNWKPVYVRLIDRTKHESIRLDAKRMLGEAMCKDGSYLPAPEQGSSEWKYAQRILSLKWPVVKVDGFEYASQSEISQIPKEPVYEHYPGNRQLPTVKDCEKLTRVWDTKTGEELRFFGLISPTRAVVVKLMYGARWAKKVELVDLQGYKWGETK